MNCWCSIWEDLLLMLQGTKIVFVYKKEKLVKAARILKAVVKKVWSAIKVAAEAIAKWTKKIVDGIIHYALVAFNWAYYISNCSKLLGCAEYIIIFPRESTT